MNGPNESHYADIIAFEWLCIFIEVTYYHLSAMPGKIAADTGLFSIRGQNYILTLDIYFKNMVVCRAKR